MPSLTQRIPDLQQLGPIVEIEITASIPYARNNKLNFLAFKTLKLIAMIDTGATGTVIKKGLAEQLGINPVGSILMNTPTSESISCLQYNVQITFPSNVNIESVIVTEAPLQGQHIQCLIGRDVLQHGVLIYTGYDNSFTLCF